MRLLVALDGPAFGLQPPISFTFSRYTQEDVDMPNAGKGQNNGNGRCHDSHR